MGILFVRFVSFVVRLENRTLYGRKQARNGLNKTNNKT